MGDLGAESLMKYLETNKSMVYLDISDNMIEDRGLFSVAKMVNTNTNL